ncbi:hypothetical protein P7K49_002212 [Saguinus oedipus]|uniref:Uncharacterized protein n=1 Tax=Saguinus oedipus TaxID=9490 RepID=A0ABQ9WGQ1_SAGOE|nr:hypothetical protein P7K49_002212 [Saguinus oedipus]
MPTLNPAFQGTSYWENGACFAQACQPADGPMPAAQGPMCAPASLALESREVLGAWRARAPGHTPMLSISRDGPSAPELPQGLAVGLVTGSEAQPPLCPSSGQSRPRPWRAHAARLTFHFILLPLAILVLFPEGKPTGRAMSPVQSWGALRVVWLSPETDQGPGQESVATASSTTQQGPRAVGVPGAVVAGTVFW